jgi:hypothetical protein
MRPATLLANDPWSARLATGALLFAFAVAVALLAPLGATPLTRLQTELVAVVTDAVSPHPVWGAGPALPGRR